MATRKQGNRAPVPTQTPADDKLIPNVIGTRTGAGVKLRPGLDLKSLEIPPALRKRINKR